MKVNTPQWLLDYWHGRKPLWKAYWLIGVLGSLLFAAALNEKPTNPNPNIIQVAVPILLQGLFLIYIVWSAVSIWRCANNTSHKAWKYLARGILIWAFVAFFIRMISDNANSAEPPSKNQSGYGTGFIVSTDGYVLTNNHNVTGCKNVTAILGDKKLSTKIAGRDKEHDLALVKIEGNYQPVTFRSGEAVLGEDIIVAGFPLTGLLTGINITKGNVSGLRGIEGNKDHFQISAPLQPGNSGSPILDQNGNVVGMVIGNLDSKLVIDTYGEIPQNINFGIGAQSVKEFLRDQKINIETTAAATALPTSSIAEKAIEFTVLVECKI